MRQHPDHAPADQARQRTERALEAAIGAATGRHCPPRLAEAIRYVVFAEGGRVRPSLCFAAAGAYGDVQPPLVDVTAAAVEMLHCASLVHDDLPCFDDALMRRGRPALHRAFSEEIAVLVGDALIISAFHNVAITHGPADRVVAVLQELMRGTGPAEGITAGQGWESEEVRDPQLYRRLKTGALFEASLVAGALAAGGDGEPWRAVGSLLGEAYQIADDLADRQAGGNGKDAGRDALLRRTNAVADLGHVEAIRQIAALIEAACAAVPPCPGVAGVRAALQRAGRRLVPTEFLPR